MYALNIHVHLDDPTSLARVLATLEDTDAHIDITTIDDDADRTQAILAAALAARDAHEAIDSDPTPPHGTLRPGLTQHQLDFNELNDRVSDYESRFRGLLADFEGASNQISALTVALDDACKLILELQGRINLLEQATS